MKTLKYIKKYNSPIDETNYYDPTKLVKKAKGIYVWMEKDKEAYIDLLMGYSSTNFGHANEDILKIVKKEAERLDNITSFNSLDKIELTEKLINLLGHPEERLVYYPVGGTKAIDAAIKLAIAFKKKNEIISFYGAFHGYSLASMSITDDSFIDKRQYGKSVLSVKSFPFPNKMQTKEKDSEKILKDIDNYLLKYPKKVAAIIIEPIQGASGFIIPPKSFLIGLDKLTKKHKVIFICDEIQVGIFRTGSFYYTNQIGINPDIILLGKSLAGGYYPLSAVIGKKELFDNIPLSGSGFDSTFANNLLGVAIANKILDFIKRANIEKKIKIKNEKIMLKLKKLKNFEFIKDINGIGMAFSFRVEKSKNNTQENSKLAKNIRNTAFKNHIIIQTAGVDGDYIKISPSFFISDKEIDIAFNKLYETIELVSKNMS